MSVPRARLVEAHEAAVAFHAAALRSAVGAGPRDYLARRGLAAFVDHPDWALGYAPAGWTQLTSHLRHHGFTDSEAVAAGLAFPTRRGTPIDRFRDRVVLGIRDQRGDVVGFVGRCAPGSEGLGPKYLNSPRSEIFAKAELPFGLVEQRDHLATDATPALVEGPLDVLAIASLDSEFVAVSALGTSLRTAQASALIAATSGGTVVTAYDGDQAGHRAALTAYSRLAPFFGCVLSARLPARGDPASLMVNAPEVLVGSLRTASPLLDDIVGHVLSSYPRIDNAEARVCALHETTRLLARMAPADVGRQVERVARHLGFSRSEVTRDLTEAVTRGTNASMGRRRGGVLHRSDGADHGSTAIAL